jgi:hypothetical protein
MYWHMRSLPACLPACFQPAAALRALFPSLSPFSSSQVAGTQVNSQPDFISHGHETRMLLKMQRQRQQQQILLASMMCVAQIPRARHTGA